MEFDFCAFTRRQLAKGINVPEKFAYFYEKKGWDPSHALAMLETEGIDTAAIKARLAQVDISRRLQMLEKQADKPNLPLG